MRFAGNYFRVVHICKSEDFASASSSILPSELHTLMSQHILSDGLEEYRIIHNIELRNC
jgi:hypothetical protein